MSKVTERIGFNWPFGIPEGNCILLEGQRRKGDCFLSFYSIVAPEESCFIPEGKEFVKISGMLLLGKTSEDITEERVMITLYKNDCMNVDMGDCILRSGPSRN
jgi:hypothetical protein